MLWGGHPKRQASWLEGRGVIYVNVDQGVLGTSDVDGGFKSQVSERLELVIYDELDGEQAAWLDDWGFVFLDIFTYLFT